MRVAAIPEAVAVIDAEFTFFKDVDNVVVAVTVAVDIPEAVIVVVAVTVVTASCTAQCSCVLQSCISTSTSRLVETVKQARISVSIAG